MTADEFPVTVDSIRAAPITHARARARAHTHTHTHSGVGGLDASSSCCKYTHTRKHTHTHTHTLTHSLTEMTVDAMRAAPMTITSHLTRMCSLTRMYDNNQ